MEKYIGRPCKLYTLEGVFDAVIVANNTTPESHPETHEAQVMTIHAPQWGKILVGNNVIARKYESENQPTFYAC